MRKSAGWTNAQYYVGSTPIFTGEVGRWNDVRFISTSMAKNGANGALDSDTGDYVDPAFDINLATATFGGTNSIPIYVALFFGEYSYGHAVGLPVEMRDNGVQDFGREHALAWYSIWGSGLLETKHILALETA
jgi:N4-gp56 family major capsid protein